MKENVHYTEPYLIDPPHPITINVIGIGGTGSQVLNSLARMHSALTALGHPGLFVRAIDPDRVTAANLGRQLFSPADLESYKCVVLISRINRFFGLDWEAVPSLYNTSAKIEGANITISCVDSGKARKDILAALKADKRAYTHPYEKTYYWIDFGNTKDRGQVVIGTLKDVKQPQKSSYNCVGTLPTIDKVHPDILKDNKKDDQGPSCSLAEALGKQDLFINTNLANMGLGILWKMFREMHIKFHGCYLNLDSFTVNPIKIK